MKIDIKHNSRGSSSKIPAFNFGTSALRSRVEFASLSVHTFPFSAYEIIVRRTGRRAVDKQSKGGIR